MNFLKNLIPNIVLIEVLVFSLVFIAIGFLFRREDPLFLGTYFSPSVLLSMVLSLYYGFTGGIPFVFLLSLTSLFLYKSFPVIEILWNGAIVLLASEFRYYWTRRIRTAETERSYLQEQVDRLRKEMFLLKLSHDQLEFNYILKPYSLRSMVEDLRDKILTGLEEKPLIEFLLSLLSQNFQVYRAAISKVADGKVKFVAGIGGMGKLDEKDPMIQEAISAEESYYIPPKALERFLQRDSELRYLAAVIASSGEEKYLLVIEDMLFVNLNEEVLSYIQVLMQYIIEDIVFSRKIAPLYRREYCYYEFVKELYKMYELRKKLQIRSSIVVFRCPDLTEDMAYEIEHSVRSLDLVCFVREKGLVVILLPFTATLNARSFVERLTSRYKSLELVSINDLKTPSLEELLGEVLEK